MITATGIRRPDEKFQLGQLVSYHHLACEVRLPQQKVPLTTNPFGETARQWVPTGSRQGFDIMPFERAFRENTFDTAHIDFGTSGNKNFAIFPADGEGVVVSLVRKGIGESVAGYESGYETPEWEPGYFAASEWVWLYVLKPSMVGMTDFLLAPMDAVAAVRDKVHSVLPKRQR